jgi:hypothetical protein
MGMDTTGPGDREPEEVWLPYAISRQPNDVTCGPTCLHSVYRFYNDGVPLETLVSEIPQLPGGGTLGVMLACHALRRGYRVRIFTYNLHIFDPTWFPVHVPSLCRKLRARAKLKQDEKLTLAIETYLDFFALGGQLRHRVMTPTLLRRYLKRGVPVLTGLNSTYLYQGKRERDENGDLVDDDVAGDPTGHFVVLCGYSRANRSVLVADPHPPPTAPGHLYHASIDLVTGAILLGIMTYDASFVLIEPPGHPAAGERDKEAPA